ncbi:type VI secretion system baseplate subunit TssG, partial [bacterium]|nr:type VI secretion system baseplate subunit TssG [bacterium]
MAAEKRQPDTALRRLLFDEFHGLSFFRAVQLIELLDSRRLVGESLSPAEEPVRFSVKPGLGFPPSDIAGVREAADEDTVEMQVTFMGLLGASGALPHWYTTLAMERLAAKDSAFTSFLDIFHHRLISLFYLAWKRNRFACRYLADTRDRCSKYFLSLIGLGT